MVDGDMTKTPKVEAAPPKAVKKKSKRDLIFKILMYGWMPILIVIVGLIIFISYLAQGC